MIDLDNQTTLNFNLKSLEKIALYLSPRVVELIITNDEVMKSLNFKHREKAQSTDVLSFPIADTFSEVLIEDMPLGSIVISESYVKHKANELGHSIEDELTLLFIHGMLHLLGFDHECDNGEMRAKEEEIIKMFNLPKSLIIRTEEF